MKRILFTISAIIAFSPVTFSQTMRIMHRSHSGSDASFSIAESEDNFGLSPQMEERMRKSDSTRNAQKKADSIKAAKSTAPAVDTAKKAKPTKSKKKTAK